MSSIYDFEVTDIQGQPKSLGDYRGKVLLIVNTASECGFTPQYSGLQELYQQYKDRGLEILAFPCNQFGGQEPGTEKEIASFCDTRFHTTFPLHAKIDVNGSDAHPLFVFLKEQAPGLLGSKAIKWNFTKFLVDRAGNVVQRYAPKDTPAALRSDIEAQLVQ